MGTKDIAKTLKYLIEKSSYSRTEIAEKVNVSKQTLYKYENGIVTNIPSDKIEAFAKLFNVSPAYIMQWGDDENCITVEVESNQTSDSSRRMAEYIKRISILASGMKEKDLEMVIGFMERLKGDK